MAESTTDDTQETRTIDMTPTIYGEAYMEANAGVHNADLHDDVRESEEWRHAHAQVVQNMTDRMVRFVLYRRALRQLKERDEFDVTAEEIDDLIDELIENDQTDGADQRVLDALEDDEEE